MRFWTEASESMPFVPIGLLYPNCLVAVGEQVRLLGGSLTEQELVNYVSGTGPTAGDARDGPALNPARPKSWHLGRVKYFFDRFKTGLAVDPIKLAHHPLLGLHVQDGAHRLLGAHYAGKAQIEWAP